MVLLHGMKVFCLLELNFKVCCFSNSRSIDINKPILFDIIEN